MNTKQWKFVAGSVVILAVLVWLGVSGFQESKTYYVTLPELRAEGMRAYEIRLRVAGNVLPGSIQRRDGKVHFTLYQDKDRLPVRYVGSDPLPDTFVDEAQAVVTGEFGPDDVFVARQVQAKCASKYEALPPGVQPESADASR